MRQGPAATRFVHDGDELVGEYDGTSGSLLRRTVHGPAVNEPLVVEEGGTRTWLYGDERGSVVALADAAGASATINTYGVHGEPGPDNRGRFGYTGQAWLAEIGLTGKNVPDADRSVPYTRYIRKLRGATSSGSGTRRNSVG